MMNAPLVGLLLSSLIAVPPLTPEQKTQLGTIKDHTAGIDDGFYALLENVATWKPDEKVAGVPVDVSAVMAAPGEYRGSLMRIEGRYIKQFEVYQIQRPGPWGNRIEQWGLQVEGQGEGGKDAVVMVYVVRPPPVPIKGRKVETVGRFYKVWRKKLEDGSTQNYLVFVAHTATVIRGVMVPPLTEIQRQLLVNATDYTDTIANDAAVYALLQNAMLWKGDEMPAAPLMTHSEPLIASPDDYRGVLLRIEGVLGERKHVEFVRGGTWEKKLEQWKVRITQENDERDEWVVLYLVDPPLDIKEGDAVTAAGRFFKVWRNHNPQNQPFNYVVLVGRSAQLLTAPTAVHSGGTGGGLSGDLIRVFVMVLLVVGFGFIMVRRYMKRAVTSSPAELIAQRRERRERERGETSERSSPEAEPEPPAGPPLPTDPADALTELERRQQRVEP